MSDEGNDFQALGMMAGLVGMLLLLIKISNSSTTEWINDLILRTATDPMKMRFGGVIYMFYSVVIANEVWKRTSLKLSYFSG